MAGGAHNAFTLPSCSTIATTLSAARRAIQSQHRLWPQAAAHYQHELHLALLRLHTGSAVLKHANAQDRNSQHNNKRTHTLALIQDRSCRPAHAPLCGLLAQDKLDKGTVPTDSRSTFSYHFKMPFLTSKSREVQRPNGKGQGRCDAKHTCWPSENVEQGACADKPALQPPSR